MKMPKDIQDPDIRGSLPALKRAARAARELAMRTRTPLYVWKDGRVVDALASRRRGRTAPA
jgi:hypothetical protein